MTGKDRPQTPGREANAAQPLGERHGLVSDKAAIETGRRETRTAGPDGPHAEDVGDTFKQQ